MESESLMSKTSVKLLILLFSVFVFFLTVFVPFSIFRSDALTEYQPQNLNFVEKSSKESENDINDLFEKLKELEQSKEDILAEIEKTKSNIDSVLETKKLLDDQVELTEEQISALNDIILKYDGLISEKQAELDSLQLSFDNKYSVFINRLRRSREEGIPGFLEIFFHSENFIDVLNSIERMNDVLSYDNRLMDELDDSYQLIKAQKESVESYKALRVSAQNDLIQTKNSLEKEVSDSLKYISDLENNIASYNSYLSKLSEEEIEINNNLINSIKAYEKSYGDKQFEYEQSRLYKDFLYKDSIIELMNKSVLQKGKYYFEDGLEFIFPIANTGFKNGYLSSYFGWRTYKNQYGEIITSNHKGIDIAVPYYTPIYASASGYVITSEYSSSYGNYIAIIHENNIQTRYAHASKLLVSEGDYVIQGELIAYVGSTGVATGNHCHFEVRINEDDNWVAVDPLDYVNVPEK